MILEDCRGAAAVTFHGGGRIERAEIRKHDLTMLRRDQTVKQVDESCLAGAGSAHDGGYSPARNSDRKVMQNLRRAAADRHVFEPYHMRLLDLLPSVRLR